VLQIEDVLKFFPDFVVIDEFKVCFTLSDCVCAVLVWC